MAKKNFEYSNEELAEIAIANSDFKCPQFPIYINDILGSTRVMMLNDLEFRAYFNLLLTEWGEKDCGLPTTDPTTVDVLVRLSRVGGSLSVDNIVHIKQFFFEYKGRLYNRRLLEERAKMIKKRETNRDNVNKRYEQPTKEPTTVDVSYSSSKGLSDNDIDNDKDIVIKDESLRETKLEPVEERKSEFGGPTYGEVKEFFVQNNRSADEALIFWNEYEQKKWCVMPVGDGPPRKLKRTRVWMLKAEQWIVKARERDINKPKNNKSAYLENSTYRHAKFENKEDKLCECGCGKPWTIRLAEKKGSRMWRVASKACFEKCIKANNDVFKAIGEQIGKNDAQNKSSPPPGGYGGFQSALNVIEQNVKQN